MFFYHNSKKVSKTLRTQFGWNFEILILLSVSYVTGENNASLITFGDILVDKVVSFDSNRISAIALAAIFINIGGISFLPLTFLLVF